MAGRSVNKVILLGHLGKDAETRFTPAGASVTSFSLATNRRVKEGEQWRDETDWHNITAWRVENLAQYLTKGKQVYIEGRLQTRSYDDKDGKKVYRTEIVAEELILLSGQGRDASSAPDDFGDAPVSMPRSARGASQPKPAADPYNQGISDDDVPF